MLPRGPFCVHDIKQGLVLKYMEHILQHVSTLGDNLPPALLLVMARLCLDFETTTIRWECNTGSCYYWFCSSSADQLVVPNVLVLTRYHHSCTTIYRADILSSSATFVCQWLSAVPRFPVSPDLPCTHSLTELTSLSITVTCQPWRRRCFPQIRRPFPNKCLPRLLN